jgi:DNA-binding NtrC family response regulator
MGKNDSSRDNQPPARIYILDDEVVTVQRLVQALGKDGHLVEGFIAGREALLKVRETPPDLIVMDIRLADADGIDLMQRMRAAAPEMEVILMTGYAAIDQAVEATKKGAFNYLEKPIKLQTIRQAVTEALALARQKRQKNLMYQEIRGADRFGEIIGASPAMKVIFKTITQVAPLDCNVLLQGESGTGKELIARALHGNSLRKEKPFVSFNCGAFADELIANELFGHEKGSFTGAVSTKLGLLETADGGTVFLDEIGEMPLPLQVKLLRVIQERNFLRVGGTTPVAIDVRFIAATNRDLEKMAAAREFRQDLYYRLKVVMIELPPLRQRLEDVPLLADHFLRKSAARFGKPVPLLSKEVLAELARYSFPGNVRELENIIERAVALCQGKSLKLADLPPDILYLTSAMEQPAPESLPVEIKDLEMGHIARIYRETGYNQTETARRLGISRTTLWRRLRKLPDNNPLED